MQWTSFSLGLLSLKKMAPTNREQSEVDLRKQFPEEMRDRDILFGMLKKVPLRGLGKVTGVDVSYLRKLSKQTALYGSDETWSRITPFLRKPRAIPGYPKAGAAPATKRRKSVGKTLGATVPSGETRRQLVKMLERHSRGTLWRKYKISTCLCTALLEGRNVQRGSANKVAAAYAEEFSSEPPTRSEKKRDRDVVHNKCKRELQKMEPKAPQSVEPRILGPRADVWREIISAARDSNVCSFMSDIAPLLKKHNGASERSLKLLHFAEEEGVPIQFVVEAMAS